MKNNLVFKFIAILLCAASLLGIIGGALGIVLLTEHDLYNKTVQEARSDRTALAVKAYTDTLTQMYAGSELGGCPDSFLSERFSTWFGNQFRNYGYRILDAEGNVLSTYNEEIIQTPGISCFTETPTGQYMHLVDVKSQSETEAENARQKISTDWAASGAANSQIAEDVISVTGVLFVHQEGWVIYEANVLENSQVHSFTYNDSGHAYDFTDYDPIGKRTGFLIQTRDGTLLYNSLLEDAYELPPETPIGMVTFANNEGFYYNVMDYENGVGTLSAQNGLLTFRSSFTVTEPAEAAEAAYPETLPTEDPGWVAETIPGNDRYIQIITPDGTVLEVPLPTEDEPTEDEPTEAAEITEATESTIPEESIEPTAEVTAPPETTVEETVEESVPSSASAFPQEVTEPILAPEQTEATLPVLTRSVPAETEPVLINGKPLEEYQVNSWQYWDNEAQESMTARYVYLPMPELTVELYVDESSATDALVYEVLTILRSFRSYLLPLIGVSLLLFAILTVYLCTAAGRKPRTEEVRAGGLNRLPLDLYLLLGSCAVAGLVAAMGAGTEAFLEQDFLLGCAFPAALSYAACLIFVGFLFAFVAQIKTPGGFWYRNTLCGHCIRLTARFAVWLENALAKKGFPLLGRFFRFLGRTLKALWNLTCRLAVWCYRTVQTLLTWIFRKLGRAFRWIGHKLKRFFSLPPLMWQWLIVGFFLVITLIIGIDAFKDGHNDLAFPLALLLVFGVIFYAAHCFGLLSESAKRMGRGDLDSKVDDKLMVGCFQEFASDLNDLAGVAVVAAQKQLKSERMKTELITNVSHDIKTPLTSIINYVDLLQKPHTPEEQTQYLEVLDRQSQRLKKLIDDLMDMSKANTGNMQVDITQVDAIESVNQALGEFADKLDRARLIPVFRHDEDRMPMMADGRLVWRVLSNLLSNAVKYAMPGTRLYIDLMRLEGKVVISLKNISREELNIDADELMERFVRGDDSRNTEGSGLGLNIAKSLMELQKGQLQLLVDGDLFKVTLIFPGI